jgi:filamentous hemagglutinin
VDSGGKSAGTIGDAVADFGSGAITAGVAAGAGALVRKTAGAILARSRSAASEVGAALKVSSGLKAGAAPTISTFFKAGWSAEQRAAASSKIATLNGLAEEGAAVKTAPKRSGASAASRYAREGSPVPEGMDVDHTHDLQLGGADTVANMKPLDSSVNRSLGVQIANGIRSLAEGTIIGSFTIGDK